MKKIIILSVAVLGLVGCSSNAGGTKGKVDCYSLSVTEGGKTVYSANYNVAVAEVHEYTSAEGKKLFTNCHMTYMDGYSSAKDTVIRAYPSRYKQDSIEYTYSRFVGYLTKENNYYLDLDAKTIDAEIKWSEYLYENSSSANSIDNKEAYSCAKQNYYQVDSGYYNYGPTYSLFVDITEDGLERHTYTMLGEDSIITYTEKWF